MGQDTGWRAAQCTRKPATAQAQRLFAPRHERSRTCSVAIGNAVVIAKGIAYHARLTGIPVRTRSAVRGRPDAPDVRHVAISKKKRNSLMANLTKSDIIASVAEKSGLSRADAGRAVDGLLDTITEALKNGDAANFVGFGSFVARPRAARTGLNPQTKEPIQIAASTVPAFKAGKALKDAVK